jgi:hypothetical protein
MEESEKITGSEPIGQTDEANSQVEDTDEATYVNCIWNGHVYSPGAYICRGPRIKMVCQPTGQWMQLHVVKCT